MSPDPIDILIEEYRTLRQESLNAINSRWSILSFGFASISASITALTLLFVNSSTKVIPGLMLVFLIPLIAFFVLTVWFGEYERMQRSGKFLALLEMRINHLMDNEILLSWENYLRIKGMSNKLVFPYNTTVFILTFLSCISMIIGIVALKDNLITTIANFWSISILKIVIILIISALIIHGIICLHYFRRMGMLRRLRVTYQDFQEYKRNFEILQKEVQIIVNRQNE